GLLACGSATIGAASGIVFTIGLGRIGSARAAVLTFIEPIVAVAVGATVFGEPLHPSAVPGGALVLRAGIQGARNPRQPVGMHPRVTIAMPAYNEEHYIEACIASVQAQDYPREQIEILIADGRSTDRTREILAELAARDPRIRV